MNDSLVLNKLKKPIDSLKINKDELEKLLKLLQERAIKACDLECTYLESLESFPNLDQSKIELRNSSTLKVTLTGINGEELFGNINEVFGSVSFPDKVKSVYVQSGLLYKANFNYVIRNQFELFLDFAKTKVLDFSLQPSMKTPNDSMFNVNGFDNTWVNGVFRELDDYFKKRSNNFSIIHKAGFYDLLVWLIGIPFGFWSCIKLEDLFIEDIPSVFLSSALFVYIFFISLLALRFLFQYSRWLYPKIHFLSPKEPSLIHQGFYFAIVIGLISKFLYDFIKYLI